MTIINKVTIKCLACEHIWDAYEGVSTNTFGMPRKRLETIWRTLQSGMVLLSDGLVPHVVPLVKKRLNVSYGHARKSLPSQPQA